MAQSPAIRVFWFGEMPGFLDRWHDCGRDDADLKSLQALMMLDPLGEGVISDTGGVRKYRFAPVGRGKSGALRVWYHYYPRHSAIMLITAYLKNETENLSAAAKKRMRQLAPALEARVARHFILRRKKS